MHGLLSAKRATSFRPSHQFSSGKNRIGPVAAAAQPTPVGKHWQVRLRCSFAQALGTAESAGATTTVQTQVTESEPGQRL